MSERTYSVAQGPEESSDDEEDEPLVAAIYARTSSPSKKFGYSLSSQVDRCYERCEVNGWKVQYIYKDENESGADQDRPGFQEMMEQARAGEFDVIVFWKLDRFSRSLIHAVQLEEQLRENDIALHSATEQIDTTTATGRFNFRNIANAAEFERDMTIKRTEMCMKSFAADHKWPNDNPPLGYDKEDNHQLAIDPAEATLVRRIYKMYLEHRSMPDVAQQLENEGISTGDGSQWTARGVGKVLRNEIYTGKYEVSGIEEFVPEYQIISQDLYERVKEVRYRFQRSEGNRPSMDKERKQENIEAVLDQYISYVDS